MNKGNVCALAIVLSAALLQGCAGAVATGAAAGAAVAHDRRTTGTIIDDQAIELKVYNRIGANETLDEQTNVSVTSFNGIVLLTGQAPSERLRSQVGAIAREVPKVRRVQNEITIAGSRSTMTATSDAWITTKVKSLMVAEKNLDATRVKVVTENGVVYLMGLVRRAEAESAVAVARRVAGVQRVVKIFEYIN